MNNKNVICLPTSGTYDIVLTTKVTAHPAVAPYPKGPFDYLVPINAGGAVELIYPIHRQILCKPEGLNNLECELSPSEYDALLEYHKSRSRGFGYGKKDTDYLFYLLGDPLPIKQPFFIKSIRVSAKKALEDFPIIRSKEAVTSAPKHETLAQEAQGNFSEMTAYDAAFDGGFISFDENGNILISERLAELDRILLNIRPNMKIQLSERAKAYMDYHRKKIFK